MTGTGAAVGVGAVLVVAMVAGGCEILLGIDKEYRETPGGGAGGTSSGGTGGVGTGGTVTAGGTGGCGGATGAVGELGDPCPEKGLLGCQGNGSASKLICGTDLKWATNGTCDLDTICDSSPGMAQGTCKPLLPVCAGRSCGDVVCDGQKRVSCGPDLVNAETLETCLDQTCVDGACVGECAPGQTTCSGNLVQSCDRSGGWQDGMSCDAQTQICVSGGCVALPPSCTGLVATCGVGNSESCCAMTAIPGGTYNRSNDPSAPATVSDFRLDRFEITVGRFRAFVNAYPGSKPAAGDGVHPLIAGSGWDAAWDGELPLDQVALKGAVKCSASYQRWTDTAGANENLPMNCINWYEAFAFCAWDGGRLPTEAEWNYAAAGGGEQRDYPWGATAPDGSYAVYDCTGDGSAAGSCAFGDILKVGSKSPKGDGKWGQSDLAGSMWEWNLDWYNSYTDQCNNCANIQVGSYRALRGGSWVGSASSLLSSYRSSGGPALHSLSVGARCARTS